LTRRGESIPQRGSRQNNQPLAGRSPRPALRTATTARHKRRSRSTRTRDAAPSPSSADERQQPRRGPNWRCCVPSCCLHPRSRRFVHRSRSQPPTRAARIISTTTMPRTVASNSTATQGMASSMNSVCAGHPVPLRRSTACASFQRDTRIAVTPWYRTVQNWGEGGHSPLDSVRSECQE